MSDFFIPLVVILLVLAGMLRQDFIFTLLYLFVGAFALGRWWSRKALSSVVVKRKFTGRAFLDEEIPVELELANRGLLPVVWMRAHESLPLELSIPNFFRQIVSLGPHEQVQLRYSLKARKRGYYSIGPLSLQTGDLLGMADLAKLEWTPDHLTVYPKIVPLTRIGLPSHSPMGTLRHHAPIFEDPSRTMGKRDYVAGDSLRRIDWKSTATTGRLQVKKFEPSIALEIAIFLNLNANEYDQKTRFYTTELAIIVAASLASWVVSKKQSVGLVANGYDLLAANGQPQPLPPRKGQGQLMRLLELLARVQMVEGEPLTDVLRRQCPHLPWGTTVVLITGQVDENLFDELFQARRSGLDAMLVICGQIAGFREIERKASHFGIPAYQVIYEHDLDIWR
jgi:uncharacterized protein (DUF58 family)